MFAAVAVILGLSPTRIERVFAVRGKDLGDELDRPACLHPKSHRRSDLLRVV